MAQSRKIPLWGSESWVKPGAAIQSAAHLPLSYAVHALLKSCILPSGSTCCVLPVVLDPYFFKTTVSRLCPDLKQYFVWYFFQITPEHKCMLQAVWLCECGDQQPLWDSAPPATSHHPASRGLLPSLYLQVVNSLNIWVIGLSWSPQVCSRAADPLNPDPVFKWI